MPNAEVHRVGFGYFIRPAEETNVGVDRIEPCFGYLINHTDGLLLVDTGMGMDPDVDRHYRPVRNQLGPAVEALGFRLEEIPQTAPLAPSPPSGVVTVRRRPTGGR